MRMRGSVFAFWLSMVFVSLGIQNSYGQVNQKINYKNYIPDSAKIINIQDPKEKIKYGKSLKTEWSVGYRQPIRGWGFFLDYGFLSRKSDTKKGEYDYLYYTTVVTLELGEKYHPKEQKPNILLGFRSPMANYTYGKINNLYTAKLLVSRRHLLAGKTDKGSISVHWNYGGGFVMGFLKPYYIQVPGFGDIKYSEETRLEFLRGNAIRHNFLKGFGEMQFLPGIALKNGFHFDIARKKNRKSAIEIGGTIEYFFSDATLMMESEPQKAFWGLYLSYQIGRLK